MLAEFAHLVEQGAELVELRLDYISTRVNIQRLLKDRPCATVITVRREQDGGKFTGSEDARLIMLREAIANGVEYVDLEDDIAGKIPRFGKTKRIISHHNFRNTPDNLRELHNHMKALDADIVKIATMANQPHDNLRMLEMMQESDCDTVGMCMGDIGISSRILGPRFGAKFTYATFHHERALAPGQLSFDQMTNVFRHNSIGKETAVYGVIADPVGHSLSPQIHNAEFGALGIDAVYVPFRVPFDTLGAVHGRCAAVGDSWPERDDSAQGSRGQVSDEGRPGGEGHWGRQHGAVPRRRRAGLQYRLQSGDGLPGAGAGRRRAAGNAQSAAGQEGVGAGSGRRGPGRDVRFAAARREDDDRQPHAIASSSAGRYVRRQVHRVAARHAPTEILVNCTPIGMHPNVDESPFNKSHLKPNMIVFDTVYNPESTLLLKEARSHGCRIVTGVEMFIRQAELQFFLFTGQEASGARMRETLKRAIGSVKY